MQNAAGRTALYSWVQGSFWMSFCVAVSFAAVYLQGLGYDNTALGAVLAAGNLLGAVLGPVLSSLVDRREDMSARRLIPWLLGVQALALVLVMAFPRKGIAAALGYGLYIAFSLSVNSLNLKLYVDFSYGGLPINYGLTRAMGSLFYVAASMILGALSERFSIRVLPVAGLVLLCVRSRKVVFQPTPLELGRRQQFKTVYLNFGMLLFVLVCLAEVVTMYVV